MKEKLRKAWEIINYPTGVNKDFDEKCNSSFYRFLDFIINASYAVFIVFGMISAYLFVTHEILK